MLPLLTLRARIIIAFIAIYLIWGSTYLAIRFTLETMPPLLTAGTRFFLAGVVLYGICRIACRMASPKNEDWITALMIGGFLLLGGNGGVVLAERTFPSGLASLFIALVPLLIALMEWLVFHGKRPSLRGITGIAIGILGVALLVLPAFQRTPGASTHALGAILLLGAGLSWSIGSILSRRIKHDQEILLSVSMQLIAGGVLLFLGGVLRGEIAAYHGVVFSVHSMSAFLYLVIFGSLVGFTAYIWLLKHVGTARASTYAFVNPVVAVFLGWWLAGETVTLMTLIAAGMVVGAVSIITFDQM